MKTRAETITGLSEIVHQHKNEQFAFAFATTNALAANDPASFHSIAVWPTKTGGYGISITKCNGTQSMSYEVPANQTSVTVYSWIVRYFDFYSLPTSIFVGSYSELIKLAASMSGDKPANSEVVHLNDALLSLILFIQRSRSYYVSRCEIVGGSPDWDCEVKRDWDDIPSGVFEKAGIKRNSHNLEAMLGFQVTEEILNSPAESLARFKTPFLAKEG